MKTLYRKNVGILLFDDVELLDFAGPYEVFAVADELNGHSLFDVFTLSENGDEIRTIHGLSVTPDNSTENAPGIDILVIPGGDGSKAVIRNQTLLDWIRQAYEQAEITFSVCSGARIPAILGLLDSKEFTTHHAVVDDVIAIAPKSSYRKGARFVDNGRLMTAAGISAGIDLSLHIVEKLCGARVKEQTMKYMEYPR
ncbi:MAG: DJ-1/PfpI family protein [Bacteroidales bacterium]|nr:DJ-1/PfpI family protein [Bacteroidales bacterium]